MESANMYRAREQNAQHGYGDVLVLFCYWMTALESRRKRAVKGLESYDRVGEGRVSTHLDCPGTR